MCSRPGDGAEFDAAAGGELLAAHRHPQGEQHPAVLHPQFPDAPEQRLVDGLGKLRYINGEYIRALSGDGFYEKALPWMQWM